ncbi:MAG: hypothetical protein AAB538_00245 [Patescibacteria group bacterium]
MPYVAIPDTPRQELSLEDLKQKVYWQIFYELDALEEEHVRHLPSNPHHQIAQFQKLASAAESRLLPYEEAAQSSDPLVWVQQMVWCVVVARTLEYIEDARATLGLWVEPDKKQKQEYYDAAAKLLGQRVVLTFTKKDEARPDAVQSVVLLYGLLRMKRYRPANHHATVVGGLAREPLPPFYAPELEEGHLTTDFRDQCAQLTAPVAALEVLRLIFHDHDVRAFLPDPRLDTALGVKLLCCVGGGPQGLPNLAVAVRYEKESKEGLKITVLSSQGRMDQWTDQVRSACGGAVAGNMGAITIELSAKSISWRKGKGFNPLTGKIGRNAYDLARGDRKLDYVKQLFRLLGLRPQ